MDENLMDKVSELLSSPDVMKSVSSIIKGVGDESKNESIPDVSSMMEALSKNGILSSIGGLLNENKAERIALLSALRPFLKEEKRDIVDLVINLLKAVGLLGATGALKS